MIELISLSHRQPPSCSMPTKSAESGARMGSENECNDMRGMMLSTS